ncbi:hypothetical protein EJ03DRAFT_192751 [Teratosphaeria nubilosa]|uniref:Uncharacterized protein n=1 Tax=Teratosphaeria nubilosa TaxID=161662 RepID=A0A6G1L0H1_9PEZI|nr:hypothetical protein EJ03DRAFT_192751 [Teratosphaeria nubilosa]
MLSAVRGLYYHLKLEDRGRFIALTIQMRLLEIDPKAVDTQPQPLGREEPMVCTIRAEHLSCRYKALVRSDIWELSSRHDANIEKAWISALLVRSKALRRQRHPAIRIFRSLLNGIRSIPDCFDATLYRQGTYREARHLAFLSIGWGSTVECYRHMRSSCCSAPRLQKHATYRVVNRPSYLHARLGVSGCTR